MRVNRFLYRLEAEIVVGSLDGASSARPLAICVF